MSSLWTLTDVSLISGGIRRLREISLSIEPGVTVVWGESGAGKTSLLNLLVGFESPTYGRIASELGTPGRLPVFWSPPGEGLWPHWTVREHLTGVAPTFNPAAADALLEEFELLPLANERPARLSQGEAARLSVARALASQARVLVLDEPLAHVGEDRSQRYWNTIRQHIQRIDSSLVIATHLPTIALREAQHLHYLRGGELLWSGSPLDFYHSAPDQIAAESLGPTNWLPTEELAQWMPGETAGPNLRPEQLQLVPDAAGPCLVQEAHPLGTITEYELQHEASGRTRQFIIAGQRSKLTPGTRVRLQALALWLLMMVLVGCGTASGGPELPISELAHWMLPPEGPRVAAPRAVHAARDQRLYVLDNAGRVLVFDDQRKLVQKWWMPEYQVGKPEKICLLRDGRLAVADTHYSRVVFFDRTGKFLHSWGELGHGPGQFVWPVALAEDDDGQLYVCEYGNNDRVQKFSPEGKFLLEFGGSGTEPGKFQRPSGIVWHDHKIYVVDAFNNRIQVFSDSGKLLEILGEGAGTELLYPYDIVMTRQQELLVVEYGTGRISKFDLHGKLLGRIGSAGRGERQLESPWGLTVNEQGTIWVADTGNRRIVEWQP